MEVYAEFRSLLREAMGDMTQRAFSAASGISFEHLNRMLNNPEINRPSKKTLTKIMTASPLVNPKDLYRSCGYSVDDCCLDVFKVRNPLGLRKRMDLVVQDLQLGFQRMKDESVEYDCVTSLIQAYLSTYAVDAKKISYSVKQDVKPEETFAVPCIARWKARKDVRHSYEVETYFALSCYCTSKEKILLIDVIVNPVILFNLQFLPQHYVDMLVEDGTNPLEMPYFSIATEKYEESNAEQRLLNAIFGNDDEPKIGLFHTTWGRGSVYQKTPDGFLLFLTHNEDYFKESEEEVELLEEIYGKPEDDLDVDEVCRDYYFDGAKGTAAVILAILHRKFQAKSYDFDIDYGESEDHEEVLLPVLYVSDEYYTHGENLDVKRRDMIDNILKEEFRLLRMPTYGNTIVYKSYDVNPKEYVLEQEKLV